MTKKCSGCGVLLQNDNIDKEGYVDDLNKDICEMLYKVDLDISGVMNPRKLIVSQPTFHAGR